MRELIKLKIGERATDDFMEWLDGINYYNCPAAKSHHGNYKGGLFDHSKCVAEELELLTIKLDLKWKRPESPWVVGLLHDVCKTDDYEIDNDSLCSTDNLEKSGLYKYNPKIHPGHGVKSILMLAGHIALTEEEKMCITYHMGAFTDKEEWKYYSNAIRIYPNVLWTHTADMIASQIKGV